MRAIGDRARAEAVDLESRAEGELPRRADRFTPCVPLTDVGRVGGDARRIVRFFASARVPGDIHDERGVRLDGERRLENLGFGGRDRAGAIECLGGGRAGGTEQQNQREHAYLVGKVTVQL